MTDEVALLLAVFGGFYLVDCLLLLKPTEALVDFPLVAQRRSRFFFLFRFSLRRTRNKNPAMPSRWSNCLGPVNLSLGFHFLPLKGRIPAALNPLTPWRLVFRCPPIVGPVSVVGTTLPLHRLLMLRLHIRSLTPLLLLHAIVLFGVLPYFLIVDRLQPLLLFLGFAFATAFLIVMACLPARRILHLSHLAYWSLALQAILCLPNSLNFPRKLALLARSRRSAAEWLPMALPLTQSRVAWEVQRLIETHVDVVDGEVEAAQKLMAKYQAEQP